MTPHRGDRVVLRPRREGDVLMRSLNGRRGIVDSVERDIDGRVLAGVILEDDPARDLGKARLIAHRFFLAEDELDAVEPGEDRSRRVLVGGIGNVFLGDDGFGVAVARRLAEEALPDGVSLVDFGIRGMDLVFALGDGYDAAVLVDAAPIGAAPGTIELIEAEDERFAGAAVEGHAMHPVQAIALAAQLAPLPDRIMVVACQPAFVPDESEIAEGLSPPVAAAVEPAARLILHLLDKERDLP